MYCMSSVCCGGESASTASFILLSGQPVKALMIVRSRHDNYGEQGGCKEVARRLQGGCGGRCGAREEKQRIGAAGAGAGQPHMMTVVVALFNVSGLREPSGGSIRHMATARSVPIAV
jgi:hypothetical protein